MLGLALAGIMVTIEPAQVAMRTPSPTAKVSVMLTAPAPSQSGAPAPVLPLAPKLRTWTSAGELEPLKQIAPDKFETTYRPPPSGRPGHAVVAVYDETTWEVGAGTIVLEGRIEVPVETETGSKVVATLGGRRIATGKGDARGRAKLVMWLGPTVKSIKVTATDTAGNNTVETVPITTPPSQRLWLLLPEKQGIVAGNAVHVFAFAAEKVTPRLRTQSGDLQVDASEGLAKGTLRTEQDTVVEAIGDGEQVALAVQIVRPSSRPSAMVQLTEGIHRLRSHRWDYGGSIAGLYSGSQQGALISLEGRRRIRSSPVHLGLNLFGLYNEGIAGNQRIFGGGIGIRFVAEGRLVLTSRVALFIGASVGAVALYENRRPRGNQNAPYVGSADGGPSVGGHAGALIRLGPGFLHFTVGYTYTPLFASAYTNAEGGTFALGYRAMR